MKRKYLKRLLLGLLILFAVVGGVFFLYVSDYYRSETAVSEGTLIDGVPITNEKKMMVADPGNAKVGLVFYAGGKVEHTAYAPLLAGIAKEGILCVAPEMPFRLAVLDISAADRIISAYPDITHWYVGGHSLGGSMAAEYASKNTDKIDGLILLAAYSAADLSDTDLRVLSVLGSKDSVLNKTAYEKNKSNLPESFKEVVIEGGNHAGFGAYGPQKGDGEADIPAERQRNHTTETIVDFCLSDLR